MTQLHCQSPNIEGLIPTPLKNIISTSCRLIYHCWTQDEASDNLFDLSCLFRSLLATEILQSVISGLSHFQKSADFYVHLYRMIMLWNKLENNTSLP
jgi:hypothetical protein